MPGMDGGWGRPVPGMYTARTWFFGFQGAWVRVQDNAEMRSHITHMTSIANAVMCPETGDLEVEIPGARGIKTCLAHHSLETLTWSSRF